MSVTTLEEVFLRVANGTADVADRKNLAAISLRRQSSLSSSAFKTEPHKVRSDVFLLSRGRLSIARSVTCLKDLIQPALCRLPVIGGV